LKPIPLTPFPWVFIKGRGNKMRGVAPLLNSPLYFDKIGHLRGAG